MSDDDDLFSPRSKGGIARREALTADERTAIARKGAVARWGVKATHKGNFQKELGLDVECYVIDDDAKTPVISQTGMAKVLGLSARGNAFPQFLATQAMSEAVGVELRAKTDNPLKFQWGTGGAEQPPATIHGFDAALLIDVCKAIIQTEIKRALPPRYARVAAQAHIIVGASAKQGIRDLVYSLAGYNPQRKRSSPRSNSTCRKRRESTNRSSQANYMYNGTGSTTSLFPTVESLGTLSTLR